TSTSPSFSISLRCGLRWRSSLYATAMVRGISASKRIAVLTVVPFCERDEIERSVFRLGHDRERRIDKTHEFFVRFIAGGLRNEIDHLPFGGGDVGRGPVSLAA